MTLSGNLFIGSARIATAQSFAAIDPASGQPLTPSFAAAGTAEIERACRLAAQVFDQFRDMDLESRARFLEAIGENILALGDPLLERAGAESGLPRARLEGERGRTIGQLRLFAELVRRGDWLGLRVDPRLPERKPLPRADLRQRKIPVGPVAVFGASNFPLAFSVAGGDTASAFAAGCPVVVKGHPAHPGTSELVAGAIIAASQSCGLPDGVFSLLNGPDAALGAGLVGDPRIKAVGFTGSRSGGLALLSIAQNRPEPIPVFAEMSSINPVLLLPGALQERADSIGQGFAGSLTQGAGQFCTNPGLILALDGPDLERFIAAALQALTAAAPGVMLTDGIHRAYLQGLGALASNAKVTTLLAGGDAEGATRARPALSSVKAADFLADPALSHEVFGASSLIVRCADEAALQAVLEGLEGQLTATLHLAASDHPLAGRLLPILERKAGRILANGWPTGVEVSSAMVHGGPFPATSDGRTSSVGTLAIERFLRPVCYQDIPEALLPAALKEENSRQFACLIDGIPTGKNS